MRPAWRSKMSAAFPASATLETHLDGKRCCCGSRREGLQYVAQETIIVFLRPSARLERLAVRCLHYAPQM